MGYVAILPTCEPQDSKGYVATSDFVPTLETPKTVEDI